MKKFYTVKVPVADLRREPIAGNPNNSHKDLLQETQLLFGEQCLAVNESAEWLQVEAVQQEKFLQAASLPLGCWVGYPGWIKKSQLEPLEIKPEPKSGSAYIVTAPWTALYAAPSFTSPVRLPLSMGTKLAPVNPPPYPSAAAPLWLEMRWPDTTPGYIPFAHVQILEQPLAPLDEAIRRDIITKACSLLGQPYLWGGRSSHTSSAYFSHQPTGFDCSGLVSLLYALHGTQLPRDAHDQFLKCEKCPGKDLQPADLIFLACPAKPRMNHVMLYAGNDQLIEATMHSGNIRQVAAAERLGKPLKELRCGDRYAAFDIYLGKVK